MKFLRLATAIAAVLTVSNGANAATPVFVPGINGETPVGTPGNPTNYSFFAGNGGNDVDWGSAFNYVFNSAKQGWYGYLSEDVAIGGAGDASAASDDAYIIKAGSWFYWKEDPVLNYAFNVQDIGAPSNFSFGISAAIAPAISGPVTERVEFAGSITDGGTDGAGISARPNNNAVFPANVKFDADGIDEIQVLNFRRSTAGAFPNDLNNEGFDLGLTETFAPGAGPYTLGNGDGVPGYVETRNNRVIGGPAAWNNWQFNVAFRGTGGNDAYALTGRAELQPVPVPAAIWLFGSALGAAGVIGRRARK